MMLYQPSVYARRIPDTFAKDYPDLNSAILMNKSPKAGPFNRQVTLTSLNGVSMQNFAKHKKWGKGEW
jgi:hypothetical protein